MKRTTRSKSFRDTGTRSAHNPQQLTAGLVALLVVLGVVLGAQRLMYQQSLQYGYYETANAAGPTGSTGAISTSTPTPTWVSASPSATLAPTATPTPTPVPATPTPTPDTAGPVVSITNPINGTTVRKGTTVTISATATDPSGVNRVVFRVNGAQLCVDLTAPYTCNWSVPKGQNRTYPLVADGYDAYNNIGSATSTVTSR